MEGTKKKAAKKSSTRKATAKQLAALKNGREELKKKQAAAKKAVRKEISKTSKSIKKQTGKIITSAKKRAAKVTSAKIGAMKKRLHKRGLAGDHESFEIYLMLKNNDGNFYNSLWDSLLKKAKKGSELSVEKLANSSVVKNQAKKMRNILKDAREDSDYVVPTLADEKEGRMMFAADIVRSVIEECER